MIIKELNNRIVFVGLGSWLQGDVFLSLLGDGRVRFSSLSKKIITRPYTYFEDKDGNPFASDSELKSYFDSEYSKLSGIVKTVSQKRRYKQEVKLSNLLEAMEVNDNIDDVIGAELFAYEAAYVEAYKSTKDGFNLLMSQLNSISLQQPVVQGSKEEKFKLFLNGFVAPDSPVTVLQAIYGYLQ